MPKWTRVHIVPQQAQWLPKHWYGVPGLCPTLQKVPPYEDCRSEFPEYHARRPSVMVVECYWGPEKIGGKS